MIAAALALLIAAPATSGQAHALAQPCARLAASLDDQGGAFDGMSHSGALLILRNTGRAACTVPGLPVLVLQTRSGRRLDITRKPPPGMHPGPVVRPLTLAPGASASTALRWVSGNVFDGGRCLTPAKIVVQTGARSPAAPFGRQLCGPMGAITFDQPILRAGTGSTPG